MKSLHRETLRCLAVMWAVGSTGCSSLRPARADGGQDGEIDIRAADAADAARADAADSHEGDGDATAQSDDAADAADSSEASCEPLRANHLSGGDWHTCVVDSTGTVRCWGANMNGQLGRADLAAQPRPVPADTPISAQSVSAGGQHTCAITTDGVLECWGENRYGQLGRDTGLQPDPVPARVNGSFDQLFAGVHHTCALSAGRALCWGRNDDGQLGRGFLSAMDTGIASPAPVVPAVGASFQMIRDIFPGFGSTCLSELDTSNVYCWGSNDLGELAREETLHRSTAPVRIDVTSVTAISLRYYHVCALDLSGRVSCWGNNHEGQAGPSNVGGIQRSPFALPMTGVIAIAAGRTHSCAIAGGQVYCWGLNLNGELGDGTVNRSAMPVGVLSVGEGNFVEVVAGWSHTCARRNDSTVWCWGWNGWGQLGDGTFDDRHTPTQVFVCH